MTADSSTNTPAGLAPAPYGATPSERQLRWHPLEFYGFVHFTINTFTDAEWGYGDESPELFNPTEFDANQIAATAAEGGMAGLILTCKHHDGFCLWPSQFTEHSVKNSPWRDGAGDIVREISDACRSHGLKVGVYLSPWDRNHAEYGRPEYVRYYQNQLRELLTSYGPIFEVWFDGANGGDGFYGGTRETRQIDAETYYDWPTTRALVRELQPDACMFGDVESDVRWIGNEHGVAGDPCWHTLDTKRARFVNPDSDMLGHGVRDGDKWQGGECDVSIRPGWFYHAAQDDEVRTPENLLDLYYKSVGRGASLLLNLPPDRRGLIHENDVRSLRAFRSRLDAIFSADLAATASASASNVRAWRDEFAPANLLDGRPATYWSTDDEVLQAEVTLEFPSPVTFNVVSVREFLSLGQRVNEVAIEVDDGGQWREFGRGAAIGNRKLIPGDCCTTDKVRLVVADAAACPALSELGLFHDSQA